MKRIRDRRVSGSARVSRVGERVLAIANFFDIPATRHGATLLKFVSARTPKPACETRVLPLDFLRSLRIKNAVEKLMARSLFSILHTILSLGLVLLVTGCGESPYSANTPYLGGVYGGEQAGPPNDTVSYWDGDSVSGSPSVKLSLGEQRAYFYKGGVLVGVSQLSTGREGRNTPSGHFSIIQKDRNHASNLYGDYVDSAGNVVVPNVDVKKDPKPPGTHFKGASMPYYMQIAPGFGLHAGYLPGYPASHGCIRMPEFMAEDFFKSVSVGTPVTITN